MLEIGAGGQRERGGVAFLVWAVELLGEESPRDTCPGPKVQRADLREEPSSTHHPGKESERPRMRPMGRGRKGLVMVKVRNDPLLIWLGDEEGPGLVRTTLSILRCFPQSQPWLQQA